MENPSLKGEGGGNGGVVSREKQTILEYLRGLNLERSALGSFLLFTIAHRYWPSRSYLHCKEDSNYVFPEIKLHGLVPNFHIHKSASDLYIPRIGRPICYSQIGRPIVGIYKSLTYI